MTISLDSDKPKVINVQQVVQLIFQGVFLQPMPPSSPLNQSDLQVQVDVGAVCSEAMAWLKGRDNPPAVATNPPAAPTLTKRRRDRGGGK